MRRNRRYGSTHMDDIAWAQRVRQAVAGEQEGPPIPEHILEERRLAFQTRMRALYGDAVVDLWARRETAGGES